MGKPLDYKIDRFLLKLHYAKPKYIIGGRERICLVEINIFKNNIFTQGCRVRYCSGVKIAGLAE